MFLILIVEAVVAEEGDGEEEYGCSIQYYVALKWLIGLKVTFCDYRNSDWNCSVLNIMFLIFG